MSLPVAKEPESLGWSPQRWDEALGARSEGAKVFAWLHGRGVTDPDAMTDLSPSARSVVAALAPRLPEVVARSGRTDDGTEKLALRMASGAVIETVLLPQTLRRWPWQRGRVSQCVSTQHGCAMKCTFCASGVLGLKGNLSPAEIVAQTILGNRLLPKGQRVRNVSFMGMGEPLHNYDSLADAIRLLTHPDGCALERGNVTVSTSGLVPQIDRLGEDFGGEVRLAISLHAVDDERRTSIMPINKKHPLDALVAALRRYPRPRGQPIILQYTLMRGFNDDVADAHRLATLFEGIPIRVGLIPLNPVDGLELEAPSAEAVRAFRDTLRRRDVMAAVRVTRGEEMDAACGQLAMRQRA